MFDDTFSPLGNSSNLRWRPRLVAIKGKKTDIMLYSHHFSVCLENSRYNIAYVVAFGSLVYSLSAVFRYRASRIVLV